MTITTTKEEAKPEAIIVIVSSSIYFSQESLRKSLEILHGNLMEISWKSHSLYKKNKLRLLKALF